MTGGNKIVGLWRDQSAEPVDAAPGRSVPVGEDVLLLDETSYDDETDEPASARWPVFARATLIIGSLAWSGFFAWLVFARAQPLPTVEAIPALLTQFAAPLILMALTYILIMRNSHAESARFADSAQMMRSESAALEMQIARMRQALNASWKELRAESALVENFGATAVSNVLAATSKLSSEVASLTTQASLAERSSATLLSHISALTETMPGIDDQATRISDRILDMCATLADRLEALEARLERANTLSADTRTEILAATKSLTAQLTQIQSATKGASDEINGMADMAGNRIDIALDHARVAFDSTRNGLDAQAEAIGLMADRSRSQIEAIGSETVATFEQHAGTLEARLQAMAELIAAQGNMAAGISIDLRQQLDGLGQGFADLEKDGLARNERLTAAITTLTNEAERMDKALGSGNATAEQLIGKSEALLLALDSGVREIDETLPLAIERLDGRVTETRKLLTSATPEVEKLEAISQSVVGQIEEADTMLRAQTRMLSEWLESTQTGLGANTEAVEQLHAAIQTTDADAIKLAESAGPKLVAALLRVRETAEQASERAREALNRTIPEAADALGQASEKAIEHAIADKVAVQMERISAVAEAAVKAAHQASDRLMRQLLTIADTSANIEKRVAEADQAAEDRDRDHYARRAALLIESLNSTAIDVTKILSHEVSDSSWSAYLKGDRGVFTRRAVKLLDAGEVRQVVAYYDDDPEFREHVNRYIHDFEAMLRGILSARDGSALGVTLLSSDMGKLYVALAQAIERLRS